ncbi:hypothetical protein PCASD_26761, partial [Puccinia coronata f. sp. avenae]
MPNMLNFKSTSNPVAPSPNSAVSFSENTATVESVGIKNGAVLQASSSPSSSSSNDPLPAPSTPAQSTPLAARARVGNDVGRVPAKSSLSSLVQFQDQSSASPSASKLEYQDHDLTLVALEAGHLILRVFPDDNSCLFRAVGILLDHGNHCSSSEDLSHCLRCIVADAVKKDPVSWCKPILGRDPDLYTSKILDKDVWGSAIAAHPKGVRTPPQTPKKKACRGCTPSQPGMQTPARPPRMPHAVRTPTNGVRTAGLACGPAGQACWPCTSVRPGS